MKSKCTKEKSDRGGSVQRANASEVERLVRRGDEPKHWRVSHHAGMCAIWKGERCNCAVTKLAEEKEERKRCWDAWQKTDIERDRWKATAILNGKRIEAVRNLTTTKHETLEQFVSRVRACLYMEHF